MITIRPQGAFIPTVAEFKYRYDYRYGFRPRPEKEPDDDDPVSDPIATVHKNGVARRLTAEDVEDF